MFEIKEILHGYVYIEQQSDVLNGYFAAKSFVLFKEYRKDNSLDTQIKLMLLNQTDLAAME